MSTVTLRSLVMLAAAALILAMAVSDLVTHSRAVFYNVDEIANVDAIHNFLTTGDYTSARFGGFPFDPFISSGVLTMWPHGVALSLGGTLLAARVASGLLVLIATLLLIVSFLRAKGLSLSTGLLVAAGVWVVQSVLPIHRDQLIMNSGEMWGFLYLCVGMLLAQRAPRLAAFFWGLATWLAKFVYLPFSVAFLAAGVLAELWKTDDRRWGRLARESIARLGAFLLPLALWMLVIGVRYGPGELPSWIERFVFVVRHHTDSAMWGHAVRFLDGPTSLLVTTLLAVASGPVALATWIWMRRPERRDATVLWLLGAAVAVAAVTAVWFVAFDVTQNARHLLPAMYVSLAVAVYCGTDILKAAHRTHAAFGVAAAGLGLAIVVWTCIGLIDHRARQGWRLSYAQTCHGPTLMEPPCQQDKALWLTYAPESELRSPPGECDNECFAQFKKRIFDHARRLVDAGAGDVELYTAAYLMLLLEHNNLYQDEAQYAREIQPVLCARGSETYRRYMAAAGLDVDAVLARCAEQG